MQPDGPGHTHGHTHGHGHAHSLGGEGGHQARWEDLLASPPLLATAATLVVAFAATIVGLVALWPDGQGQDAAIEQAAQLGLGTERFDAVVTATSDGPCSYADPVDPETCRNLTFDLKEGPEAGSVITLSDLPLGPTSQTPDLAVGDRVVLGYEPSTSFYFYADRDRGSTLVWLAVIFSLVVVALGRRQGVRALFGMALTLVILVGFVARSVLDGHDPLTVAVVAASLIAFVSLFLTHGFNPHAAVALVGTLASLVLTLGLSWAFFRASRFTGLATEEGLTLPLVADVNLVPLLLGGALLGTLGALDDVTVTQVAPWPSSSTATPTWAWPSSCRRGCGWGGTTSPPPSTPCCWPTPGPACRCSCCSPCRTRAWPRWPTPSWWRSRSCAPCAVRSAWWPPCR